MNLYLHIFLSTFLVLSINTALAEDKEKVVKEAKPSEDEKDYKLIDQSEKGESPKADLFDPPQFKEPGVAKKAVARIQTEINTKADGIPEISLKAKVLKDEDNAMAVLLIGEEEILVEPNEVFPIVIKDKTWELSIKSITRNGVALEINYNSIKLLVK